MDTRGGPEERRYPPIADYALLSDCHSAALVSRTLSVDWACPRRFDAPSVFGRILDWDEGGHFTLYPEGLEETSRRYIGDSLVLETVVTTETGRAKVIDAFAMRRGGIHRPYHQLVRVIEGLEGRVTFDVVVEPRFDYGELRPWLREHRSGAYSAVGGDNALIITSPVPLEVTDVDKVHLTGRFTVSETDRVAFSVQAQEPHRLLPQPSEQKDLLRRLDETLDWWDRWASRTVVSGRYAEEVRRSAVVLKGLTCGPTGAIVAAPTTSLPEQIGGERNWDYRYTWIRDSTLVLSALCSVGHDEVAEAFRDFLMRTAAGDPDDVQIMYGPYGGRFLPEIVLDRLEGYQGSRPVRVGNGASKQTQHDMYGQILDAALLWRRTHQDVDPAEWRFLERLVEEAISVWREPDHGMWEVRGAPQHFTSSKVMTWVAVDRGVKTVEDNGDIDVDIDRWRKARDEMRRAVDEEGVHPTGGHFVQAFGSTEVDAGLLLLPMVGFCEAGDPRMVATVDAIVSDLAVPPEGFIRRYRTETGLDGLEGGEGTFLMCSFWLAEVLARQGRRDEAVELFERLLECANDLGLYAEEYDATNRRHLGNFPQAFTHMSLINAAHQLALEQASPAGWDARLWPTGANGAGAG